MANSIAGGVITLEASIREVFAQTLQGGGGSYEHKMRKVISLANGTTDGSIDRVYSVQETGIGASVTTQYDLAGTLKDQSNNTITFAEVVFIALVNLSTTPANFLLIGPHATNGFGALATGKGFWNAAADRNVCAADADGVVVLSSRVGVPVTAGTGDILDVITQSATSANTWMLIVAGRSA